MTSAMARLRIPAALLFFLLPGMAAAQVMTAYLNHLDLIPLQDPYCDLHYPDQERPPRWAEIFPHLCPRITVASIPPATGIADAWRGVIDWVLIELRETSEGLDTAATYASDTVIARKPAFLLSNGRVVDAAAYSRLDAPRPGQCFREDAASDRHCPGVWFDRLTPDENKDLYVVVRHRNHLGVMSASPMAAVGAGGVYAHDFSTGFDSARGRAGAQKDWTGSRTNRVYLPVTVMIVGDTNEDGIIQQVDVSGVAFSNQGLAEYNVADFNLNGIVQSEDILNYAAQNLQSRQRFSDF